MMSEAKVKAYRVELEWKIQNAHEARMLALACREYDEMEKASEEFQGFVEQIRVVDTILEGRKEEVNHDSTINKK